MINALLDHLNILSSNCKKQAIYDDALKRFPKFHMHDKFTKSLSIVDEKKWQDYTISLGKMEMLDPMDDQWSATVISSKQCREPNDLSLSIERTFCCYISTDKKYIVWKFRASTGLMIENDFDTENNVPLLMILLEERLYSNAKGSTLEHCDLFQLDYGDYDLLHDIWNKSRLSLF